MNRDYFPWQKDGIAFLRSHERAILADDPGTGKTRQLLEAATGQTLVVAPAYAEAVWEDEFVKWQPDCDLHFVSYSSLCQRVPDARGHRTRVVPRLDPAYRKKWDTIVFDEGHFLKGRKTNWSRAAQKLRGDRIWMATGTPFPNFAHELWMLLRILKPDDAFLRSYWRWVDHWFDVWEAQWSRQVGGLRGCSRRCDRVEVCAHWRRFFDQNLAGLWLRRTEDQTWKDRPPLTQQTIRVEFTSAQRREYRALKRDYRAYVTEVGTEVVAWSDGDLAQKLRRLTTHAKLPTVASLLRDRRPPIVLFCWYRATAEALSQIASEAGLSVAVRSGGGSRRAQDDAVRAFQAGQADVLVATLATSSEAISLTRSATAVLVEASWRPSTNRQAIKRLHRIGQSRPVTVLHLACRDSVDERMLRRIMRKRDAQIRLMRAGEFAELL